MQEETIQAAVTSFTNASAARGLSWAATQLLFIDKKSPQKTADFITGLLEIAKRLEAIEATRIRRFSRSDSLTDALRDLGVLLSRLDAQGVSPEYAAELVKNVVAKASEDMQSRAVALTREWAESKEDSVLHGLADAIEALT